MIFIVVSVLASRSSIAQNQVRNYEIDDLIKVVKISDRVILVRTGVTYFDAVTAIATEKGIVLIDAGISPQLTEKYKQIIAKEFSRNDFTFIIHTHSHCDHTWGNQVFPEALIIGHDTCKEEMITDNNDPNNYPVFIERTVKGRAEKLKTLDVNTDSGRQVYSELVRFSMAKEDLNKGHILVLPSITFSDKLTLSFGDETLEIIYFGNAHSESDILVYIPEEKLLFCGDLFFSGGDLGFGAEKFEKANVRQWHNALAAILKPEKNIEKVIHGHGMIMTKNDLIAFNQHVEELWTGLQEGKKYCNPNALRQVIEKSGIEAAVQEFHQMRTTENDKYFFLESGFKNLAYQLLRQNKTNEAIEIFKMNLELFPESWDAYDSLGEAHMKAGNKELAIENYEKSLELNPQNANASERLEKLREKK
jgi:glyoxylase-like metal-dependent hydrolase (beta-lactamase superfamily II)